MTQMKVDDFVAQALNIAENYKTLYVMGCFGAPLTGNNVIRYLNNHSYNQKPERQTMIYAVSNKEPPVYGFDCVCFIKGILWGWSGDATQTYGGAKYNSNDVPDIDANQMIDKCTYVSNDFSKIEKGAVVWMDKHIGIYVGNGQVVEASPKWNNCVQITYIKTPDFPQPQGHVRTWKRWGLLPYVDYTPSSMFNEDWFIKLINEAVEVGITDGSNPTSPCTRGEAMIIAYNAYKKACEYLTQFMT